MNEPESNSPPSSPSRGSRTNTGIRLDRALSERGLAASRERAQALIAAGLVTVNGAPAEKASQNVTADSEIIVLGEVNPYVGRGGLKLEAALKHFRLKVTGLRCLDVGASTGGFTDCLLKRGAGFVVALDVGHGQLAESLRLDPRVEAREGVNARYLSPDQFTEKFDLVVIDVSFISLTLILPAVAPLLRPGGHMVALVKPEFEAGRENVGPGGIVRSENARWFALKKVVNFARDQLGLDVKGTTRAPAGGGGNREFFAYFRVPGERKPAQQSE